MTLVFFSSERARDVPRPRFLAREAGNQMGSIAESLSVRLSVRLELSKFPVGVPRGTPLRSRAPLVRCGTEHAFMMLRIRIA